MRKRKFFDDRILLRSPLAAKLYGQVETLPIVDYHSHLSEKEIAEDKTFSTITEFWLGRDHYKWRAMRSCGVDESLITGDAADFDKFLAYAKIMPKLAGNPLYYWAHMELKSIFGIELPLNEENAPKIYLHANEILKTLSVRTLLEKFRVEYIATTDDPTSTLEFHGTYGTTRVCPTFRPDRALRPDAAYLTALSNAWGRPIRTLADYRKALEDRLGFFISHGCTIADTSIETVPLSGVEEEEAEMLFSRIGSLTEKESIRFYSYAVEYLAGLYRRNGIVWQLHIGAFRNINSRMYRALGCDAGYDVMSGSIDTNALARFFDGLSRTDRLPKTILYALNADAVPALCTIAPCFPDMRIGAAWWFNDTTQGIADHLKTLQEYGCFGTSLGMLTDSRSFSSYCRFDFFRRILASSVADLVNAGEYDEAAAVGLMTDICYSNPKKFMNL